MNMNLLRISIAPLFLLTVTTTMFIYINYTHAQIFPQSNNIQNTSPNNRTSIMIMINHGEANYTISDFLPTLIQDKCPLTAHIIDNNNSTGIPAKPVIICYV